MTTPVTVRLVLDGVVAAADGRPGSPAAVEGVSLAFAAGTWTALVGPNGAGKSTLLRVAAGLLKPRAGRVMWGAADGTEADIAHLAARERARRIAWLSQHTDGGGELAVRDVVGLGRLPHVGLLATASAHDASRVDAALQATGCAPWAARRLATLSGGERQRALIGRALAVDAPLLLLDEPTSHLDPPHQAALVRLVRQSTLDGTTVVTVLHDLSLALLADRVVVMASGRVVADAAPAEPALHAALARVFDDALRVVAVDDGHVVVPRV